jgi:hypothetical protein
MKWIASTQEVEHSVTGILHMWEGLPYISKG